MSVVCCHKDCGRTVEFPEGVEERLRRSGEAWHCLAGHRQWFIVGKTDEQKEIESLKQQVGREQRNAASANRRACYAEGAAVALVRDHLRDKPGIYDVGNKRKWVCTCGKVGSGTDGGPSWCYELLLAHQEANLCNPVEPAAIRAAGLEPQSEVGVES